MVLAKVNNFFEVYSKDSNATYVIGYDCIVKLCQVMTHLKGVVNYYD